MQEVEQEDTEKNRKMILQARKISEISETLHEVKTQS